MPKTEHPRRSADAGRELAEALRRLIAGEPRNADLREAAARGRLRISVSSVAKEAGRSRTLIGVVGRVILPTSGLSIFPQFPR